MARRPTLGLLAILFALVLAACAGGVPPVQSQSWTGTTTSADGTFGLTIATTLDGAGAWPGTYTVDRVPLFTGDVDADLSNGELVGELVVSADCRFALAGTMADDVLTATFSPTACPSGVGGTWSVTLSTSTPGAVTVEPDPDAATFDEGAVFGAAVFR